MTDYALHQVAERAGITPDHLRQLEDDEVPIPDPATVARLETALGLEAGTLERYRPATPHPVADPRTAVGRALLALRLQREAEAQRANRARHAGNPLWTPYSLRRVAERVGVTASYYSRIERGMEPQISEEVITKAAAYLGGDPDELLALAGKIPAADAARIMRRPKRMLTLLRAADQLSDAELDRLMARLPRLRRGTEDAGA